MLVIEAFAHWLDGETLHEGWAESLEKCTENEIQNVLKSVAHPHFRPRLKAFLGGAKMNRQAVTIPPSRWRPA